MDFNPNELPFPVSAIEFDKVYRVMDRRLVLGFSDRELSFLLGYRALYVRDVEDPLHTLRYTPKDTNYLLQILDCGLKVIMAPKLETAFFSIFVTRVSNGVEIYLELPGRRRKLYRKISFGPVSVDGGKANMEQVQGYMNHLFSRDFFREGKTALEVYQKFLRKFGKPLQPQLVADALAYYTAKRKSPKLIRMKNESARTIYKMS